MNETLRNRWNNDSPPLEPSVMTLAGRFLKEATEMAAIDRQINELRRSREACWDGCREAQRELTNRLWDEHDESAGPKVVVCNNQAILVSRSTIDVVPVIS
jgi:hypothetical protein